MDTPIPLYNIIFYDLGCGIIGSAVQQSVWVSMTHPKKFDAPRGIAQLGRSDNQWSSDVPNAADKNFESQQHEKSQNYQDIISKYWFLIFKGSHIILIYIIYIHIYFFIIIFARIYHTRSYDDHAGICKAEYPNAAAVCAFEYLQCWSALNRTVCAVQRFNHSVV